MGKLETPEWIKKGYKSKEEYGKKTGKKSSKKQGKTFKVRKCPECESTEVSIVLIGEEGKKPDRWECKACKWKGRNIEEKELSGNEFLEHMEKMEGK